jgi:hypothetical protein
VIKTRQVVAHFERCTGRRLVVSGRLRTRLFRTKLDILTLPDHDNPFGPFEIIVYLNPDVAPDEPFLTEPVTFEPTRSRWARYTPERLDEQAFWFAWKMYGNVLLKWQSEIPPRPSEQWRQLDRILSTLPGMRI